MAARRSGAALLLGALLAGCAVGGGLPPSAPIAPAREGELTAADGSGLATSIWQADAPQAILLALHGYGDYGPSTFSAAGVFWAGQGITTIAYDQRGFGRNPSRGIWPGAEALIADLKGVVAQLRARHPCLPLIVLGHSMGGGVVLAAGPDLARGALADGMVLAAPAIWGGAELNPFHRLAAWGAAAMVPERRFTGEGVVRIQASDNIDALRALGRDPLYLSPPSAREIFGLVRVVDRAEAAADEAALPTLLLTGEKDQILPRRAVRRVFDRLPGSNRTIEYTDGWHLLFRDLQAERVWSDVVQWILARPGPACDS
ncbi:MAG: alpha/beta fold hydrolase [Pseudomonadota bacterium]